MREHDELSERISDREMLPYILTIIAFIAQTNSSYRINIKEAIPVIVSIANGCRTVIS